MNAEFNVSFDNGPNGSIAEDLFFVIKAMSQGYLCDWIEGEMREKSPLTIKDFLKQRKRWVQGTLLVIHSRNLPLKNKIFLIISTYAWILTPLTTLNLFLPFCFPVASPMIVELACAFIGGVSSYMQIFGTIKSLSFHHYGFVKTFFAVIFSICVIPLKGLSESIAVIWGLVTEKHQFYVIKK
jgi:beta-1,4-mannosyltransferase